MPVSSSPENLLITLGTSWAVVPEAFLHPDHHFAAVHVLTTASERIDPGLEQLRAWFADEAPEVALTISRVEGFHHLNSEEDHARFEEVLLRWYLLHSRDAVEPPAICLSGGFKTMSASMQQAAELFGAGSMFHVLCESNPNDAASIAEAHQAGRIDWIELGMRQGWPALRHLASPDFPLRIEGEIAFVPAELTLRAHVANLLGQSQNIAASWDALERLPFKSLATLPRHQLDWLAQPVDPDADRAWIHSLPKVELHCHLGGFATHGDLLDRVRAAAEHPATLPALKELPHPEGWPVPCRWVVPEGSTHLQEYMKLGDNNGSALLRDPGCLQRQMELLYRHFQEQNIRYVEVRCSPGNYASQERDRSAWDVLSQLIETFTALMKAARKDEAAVSTHVNLIIIATRRDRGDFRTAISRHLSLAVTASEHWRDPHGCRVVGVDLAGFEDPTTRPHYFREDFTAVHRAGLAVTIHAGENDDAEAIWSAVFDLNARRIGHALHLIDSPALRESVAARRVGVEMCPYANLQIKNYPMSPVPGDPAAYPLADYLRQGIPVSVNTDNIGISAADLSQNLALAAQLCPGLTRFDLLGLIRCAAETAFLSAPQREELLAQLDREIPRRS